MGPWGATAIVLTALAAAPAAAQSPTAPAATTPLATTTPPPSAVGLVPAGGKDYFGPPLSSKFDEKAVFPDTPPAIKAAAPQPLPPPKPIVLSDGTVLPPPPPIPPVKIWFGGAEVGLNGSQGNADVLNLRLGMNADRKTYDNRFHVDGLYTLNRESGGTKQNQAILNARDEILFGPSPWSVFSALQIEYDQFRAFDFRVGTYAGLSRRWIKTDDTFFSTRVGAGAVRELSHDPAVKNRWVPEAVLGGDFNHRFTDRQAYVSSVDLYPNLSQIGQYRLRARAAYEIVIDPAHGMVLRLGVQERYDSSPGPAKRNDVNYFTTLLFKF